MQIKVPFHNCLGTAYTVAYMCQCLQVQVCTVCVYWCSLYMHLYCSQCINGFPGGALRPSTLAWASGLRQIHAVIHLLWDQVETGGCRREVIDGLHSSHKELRFCYQLSLLKENTLKHGEIFAILQKKTKQFLIIICLMHWSSFYQGKWLMISSYTHGSTTTRTSCGSPNRAPG